MIKDNNIDFEEMRKLIRDIHKLFFGELPAQDSQSRRERFRAEILIGNKKHRPPSPR